MYNLTGDREKDLLILERLIKLYRESINLDDPADGVWTDYATTIHYRLERQYEELKQEAEFDTERAYLVAKANYDSAIQNDFCTSVLDSVERYNKGVRDIITKICNQLETKRKNR